ncbi:type II secretion system F family protein [Clostridium ganghwense]|uniref:Type II secretion system F family protein n=1 Tax=Clostridium ganghwense TaxID=312089 RepID=A0ABT4CMR1_9CLOT|nr:type II secretion system F family protein [Clostridium ganghwense]MCY6370335.1 type II secretion system F family protein [Clostridium ganghwense]
MKTYKYKAVNLNGNFIKGKYILNDEKELIELMRNKGYFLIDYRVRYLNIKDFSYKVSCKDIAIFCKQLSEILKCGINITRGLDILLYQKLNSQINTSLYVVKSDVEKGKDFSESLDKFPKIYPKFMVHMIKIGEQSGNMEKVLLNLYEYYWKEHNVYTKIRSLLIYPVIVFITTIVITIIIITKIIPIFINNLAINNMHITEEVKEIMTINKFINSNESKIIAVCLLMLLMFIRVKGYDKRIFNMIKFSIPGIKEFYKEIYEIKFAQSLSLLISSGVPILTSLEIIQNSFNDKYHKHKISNLILNIREGMSLSNALENTKLFEKFFVSMVLVGEETGNIDEMLDNVASIYEENINGIVNKISSLIEPITILILSIIITFVIVKFMFPIIDIMDSIETMF